MKKLKNKVILADCLDHLQTLDDNLFDHCITDPPYNISGYDNKKKIGWLSSNKIWEGDKKFIKIDEKWDSFTNEEYFCFCYEFISEITRVVKNNGVVLLKSFCRELFGLQGKSCLESTRLLCHGSKALDASRDGPMPKSTRFGIDQHLVLLARFGSGLSRKSLVDLL